MHAAGGLPHLRGAGRSDTLGDRQTSTDQGLHGCSWRIGAKLSWQETAVSFRTTWDKVCQSVEYVVQWGIEHRQLGPIVAIGVDEIQYAKGHKYLTLVYQIEQQCTRLLWIGWSRTMAIFRSTSSIGEELAGPIGFV